MSWFDQLAAVSGVDQDWNISGDSSHGDEESLWKYLSVGDISGLSDYTNREYNYRDIPFVGQMVGHAADANASVLSGMAQFLNMDDTAKWLDNMAQEGANKLPPMAKPELSLAYATDPNGLASATGSIVGSMLPLALGARFLPGAVANAPARAAATAARSVGAPAMVSAGIESFIPSAIRWAATGPLEAMVEGGSTEMDARKAGMSKEDANAAAWDVFRKNAALLAVTNGLEGGLLGRLGKALKGVANGGGSRLSKLGRAAMASAPTTAAEIALNGYEEGAQTGFSSQALGEDVNALNPLEWNDEQIDAAKMGIAGTIPIMGTMGFVNHLAKRAEDANDPLKNGQTGAQIKAVNNAILNAQDEGEAQAQAAMAEQSQPEVQDDVQAATQTAPQTGTANNTSGNSDVSDLPMQDIEDKGLANTNPQLKAKYRQLFEEVKAKFGKELVVSGGARSKENNDANNGSPTSHHLFGDAIDVDYSMLSEDEKAWALNRASELGFNKSGDTMHDNHGGNGDHMHLTYEADTADNGTQDKGSANFKSSGNSDYDGWIKQYASQYGVPANLLSSLLETESGYRPDAVSEAGAIGIAQFMPETAKVMGIDPHDPQQSIEGAARYLSNMYEKYHDWHKALEAYNGGEGNMGIKETMAYADKVLAGAGDISANVNKNTNTQTAPVDTNIETLDSDSLNDTSFNDDQLGADFYATLNSDLYNGIASTPNELNALGEMQDLNGDYIDTPENRALMAELFPEYTEQAKAKYLASKADTPKAKSQTTTKPAAPTIETAEGKYLDQAREMLTALKVNNLLPIAPSVMEQELASGDSERVNKAASFMQGILKRHDLLNKDNSLKPGVLEGKTAYSNAAHATNARPQESKPSVNTQQNNAPQVSNAPVARNMALVPVAMEQPDAKAGTANNMRIANAIAKVAADNNVSLLASVNKMLKEGQPKAIKAAQQRLEDEGINVERATEIVAQMRGNNNAQTTNATATESTPPSNAGNQVQDGEPRQSETAEGENLAVSEPHDSPDLSVGTKDYEHNQPSKDSAQGETSEEWIASHKFKYDDSKTMEENIAIAESLANEYIEKFGTTDKINTPEREKLRQQIVDELYGKGATKKEKKIFLIVGVPASGKSTISDPIMEREGAILVDSDEAKKKIPEFADGLLAGAVHEESAQINIDLLTKAVTNGDNIVMPIVGKTESSLVEKINKLKAHGYSVNLVYVDLPIEKAIERVKARFKDTGRLVSPTYLQSVGLKSKQNYDKLKVAKEVDHYEAWNNDVAYGEQPIFIEQGDNAEVRVGRLRTDNGEGVGEVRGTLSEASSGEGTSEQNSVKHSDTQGAFSTSGNNEADDYHGYLDGKPAGAVAKIKKALATKIDTGISLLSAKHLLEIYADKDNPPSHGKRGRKYYVSGVAVPKAAYLYYEYLIEQQGKTSAVDVKQFKDEKPSNEPQKAMQEATPANNAPAMSVTATYSDNSGGMRGGIKDGIITAWQKTGNIGGVDKGASYFTKQEFSIEVTLQEIDSAAQSSKNSNYGVRKLAEKKYAEAVRKLAKKNPNRKIFSKEDEGYFTAREYEQALRYQRDIDSFENVLRHLYEEATGHAPKSAFEAHLRKYEERQKNIANGKDAIKRVLEKHEDVPNAMYRKEIGSIDFLYGDKGTDAKKHEDSYGIAKIELKHGREAVDMIPEVIAKGEFKQTYDDQASFIYNGYRAVVHLPWNGDQKTWLITSFLDKKIKNPDAADDFVRSATTTDDTISPSEQGSFSTSNVAETKPKDNTTAENSSEKPTSKLQEVADASNGHIVIAKSPDKHYGKADITQENATGDTLKKQVDEMVDALASNKHVQNCFKNTTENTRLEIEYQMDDYVTTKLLEDISKYKDLANQYAKANIAARKEVIERVWDKLQGSKQEPAQSNTQVTGFEGGFAKASKYFKPKKKAEPKAEIRKVVNVVDEDSLEDAFASCKKAMNKVNALGIFNPEFFCPALKIGLIYLQKGINKFADWSIKMIDSFKAHGFKEEEITPWIAPIWETLSSYPNHFAFDEEMMTDLARAIGDLHNQGHTSYKDVIAKFNAEFDEDSVKELEPVIKAAYNGINKFYTDLEEAKQNGTNERGEGESESPATRHSDVEPGAVRGANEDGRGEGNRGDGRDSLGEPSPQSRDEADDTSADGRAGEPGGRGAEGMGSANDSAGNGAGGTKTPVHLNGDKPAEVPGSNYHMKRATSQGAGGEKTKAKNSIKAIKLLKELEREGRTATPSEQETLAGFNGWGSIATVFSDAKEWKALHDELKELLTEEEYKTARRLALNAFYTEPSVVKAIWEGVKRLGFNGGRVLDPSMGVGNFFSIMPVEMAENSQLYGIDVDPIAAGISKQLYQKASIQNIGYEKASLPNNFFDLAISNIPFGDTSPFDPEYEKTSLGHKAGYLIHNYFFAKSIDKVRPGGLMIFITSQGTMQSDATEAKNIRTELASKADLVGAIKLPVETFHDNAGTKTTTDLLIFQKREDPKKPAKYAQKWDDTDYISKASLYGKVNGYYRRNEGNVIGEYANMGRWGSIGTTLKGAKIADIAKELKKRLKKLPKDIYTAVKGKEHNSTEAAQTYLAEAGEREYSFSVVGDKAMQVVGGKKVEVPSRNQNIVKSFVKLRQAVTSLFAAQIDPNVSNGTLDSLRKDLNTAYDKFVKKHGYINKQSNMSRLNDDPAYGMVSAIENYEKDGKKETATKRDIFTKRTVGAIEEKTTADSSAEALALSLNHSGKVDTAYMANLMGISEDAIIRDLDGTMIFKNPSTNSYETREEYLSGNVRAKLAIAEVMAKTDPSYQKNVDALEKVQPADLTKDDIKTHIGAPWIDADTIVDFINYMIKGRWMGDGARVYRNELTGKWNVDKNKFDGDYTQINEHWGASGRDFFELMNALLNMRSIEIKQKDSNGNEHTDETSTAAVTDKMNEIQDEFVKWVWQDKARTERLVKTFNKLFNSEIERDYDGSSLTFPGLNQVIKDKLYPHQKDVIWRMLQGGNTLIAHCVGAGKTFSMQIAGMEMKRMGIIRKPMYVLPNSIVEQFKKEFYQAYPNAKLLVLTSKEIPGAKLTEMFEEDINRGTGKVDKKSAPKKKETAAQKKERLAKRRAGLSRIATEDWDGIIISHETFKSLPMSPEYYQNFYEEQLEELEKAILAAKENELSKKDIKDLETAKEKMLERLERDISEDKKEIVIPFEQLGVDQIFVDEADLFKNLKFHTSMSRLSGVNSKGSQRAMDMLVKTKFLSETHNGRGVVFATGTPISNSMNEMFTMMRYLMGKKLKELQFNWFDAWAAMFATKSMENEPSPDGSGFRMVEKLKFSNLRALGKLFRTFADIKLPSDLPYLKRPALKGGKRTVISVEAPDALTDYKQELLMRANGIKLGIVDKTHDNMLKLTNDFRNASMDMRLVRPRLTKEEAGGKIEALVDNIAKVYEESKDVKGAQVVFSDIGVPKPKEDKDTDSAEEDFDSEEETQEAIIIYEEIKKELIARGIPENEIGFAHDAKNAKQRQALFEKVNKGEIRVFIGSTGKMGAGVNFQHHLIALHHLDCPWKPRDIEQREGRILRAGNENPEVQIYSYVTEGSFDANMWDKVSYKQRIIDSVMSGDPLADEMDDINSDASASFADIEALAMDDPLMADRVKVNAEVTRLQALAKAYNTKRRNIQHELKSLPGQISTLEKSIERTKEDVKRLVSTRGEDFKIKIGDKVFTKRADAKALWDNIVESFSKDISTKVGEIGGMEIHMLAKPKAYKVDGKEQSANDVTVQLVGSGAYAVSTTSLEALENKVNDGIQKDLKQKQNTLQELQDRQTGLEKELAEPFKKQDELNEATQKLAEIDAQLKAIAESENGGRNADSAKAAETTSESGTRYSADSVTGGARKKKRAISDLIAEIKSALPGAKNITYDDDGIHFTMPNGAKVHVTIRENMTVANEDAVRKAHGIKQGVTITVNGVEYTVGSEAFIELSRAGKKGSMYHELFHAVWDMALTDKEKAALRRAYSKEAQSSGRDLEEVCADKFRDWKTAKAKGKWTNYGKIWQTIQNALESLRRIIAGTEEAHKIFKQVESGEVWKRTPRQDVYKENFAAGADNGTDTGYNEGKKGLSREQKTMLSDTIEKRIDEYIAKANANGADLDGLMKEMQMPNSQHRADLLGSLKANLTMFQNNINDAEFKRAQVERIKNMHDLSDTEIDSIYAEMLEDLKESVDYAGVVYEAVASDRRGNQGLRREHVLPADRAERRQDNGKDAEGKVNNDRTSVSRSDKGGFSRMHYSVSAEDEAPQSFLDKTASKLAKRLGLKGDKIIIEERKQRKEDETMGFFTKYFASPSRIANKVAAFRQFYRMGDRAMNAITKNRSWFNRKLEEAYKLAKTKEDRKALFDILLDGDTNQHEYTKQELLDDGVSENVANAYVRIRTLINRAYKMVNEARRRPKFKTITGISERKLRELKDNPFVEITQERENEDGQTVVTYKEFANYENEYHHIDQEKLDELEASENVQVLSKHKNNDGTYDVTVREGIGDLNKLEGYIPHLFHEYMVRVLDKNGNYLTTIGSGRTEHEAVQRAEAWLKDNELEEGATIHIAPKAFDFTKLGMDETQNSVVLGDKDFYKMMNRIAKYNDIELSEVKEMLKGSVRQKNRHRFLGNTMHRKGVEGYEKDLDYVLRHYFGSVCRYHALETMFKPQAINMYERLYGDFNKIPVNSVADYVHDYISDINGNPTKLEKELNALLNKSKFYRTFIAANFGDRAALRAVNKLTSATSYLCLGYLNVSSALLNFMQVMNSAAYIGDVSAIGKCIARGAHRKYNLHDLRILMETNVLNDIGLDSGAGYDMNRMSAKDLLGKLNKGGMILFKESEGIVRRGTVLAAYESGRARGMTHEQAIEFAKDVNRKSNFDYGVADAPNIFRRGGVISQLILQFKKYGIKELEVMADMFPTNNKTSFKQKAIFWACYFLAAGLMDIPFIDLPDEWFEGKLKLAITEEIIKMTGGSELGKFLGKTALYGIGASTVGIDISNRVGLSDVFPSKTSDLAGAALSKSYNFVADLLKGDKASMIRDVSPGVYNQYAAWIAGHSEGKRGRTNNVYDSFYDKALRAIGFKSTAERVDSDVSRIATMRKSKLTAEKQQAIDDYIADDSTANAMRLKELGITPKQVREERAKKKLDRLERSKASRSKSGRKKNQNGDLYEFAE